MKHQNDSFAPATSTTYKLSHYSIEKRENFVGESPKIFARLQRAHFSSLYFWRPLSILPPPLGSIGSTLDHENSLHSNFSPQLKVFSSLFLCGPVEVEKFEDDDDRFINVHSFACYYNPGQNSIGQPKNTVFFL